MTKNYPKISIIVHLFNRETYLKETLDSILDQNYPNLELIVVDDGSTDKSWEILEGYGAKITHKERLTGSRTSPVEALNVGFKHSTGEIMTWINTKNILHYKSLFVVADIFQSLPHVEWLTGLGTMIDDESRYLRTIKLYRSKYDYLMNQWEVIQQESTFWKRSLWDKAGSQLDLKYPWSFDAALWAKFFLYTEIYHVNTILGAYRENPQGQSVRQRPVLLENTYRAIEEMRKNTPRKTRVFGFIYRIVRTARPLLRGLPDAWYARIPLLNTFCYAGIEYHSKNNVWMPIVNPKNPFRVVH